MSYHHLMTSAEAIADERGIDDASIDYEEAMMERLFRAEAAYRDALAEVGRNSYFYSDKGERLQAFNDFASDECPDPESWKEKIAEVTPPQRN